jgi:lipopolysaccharide biosynthesis glycosyltransferase
MKSKNKQCIVFIANGLALPGLRAAVSSCVEQLAADALDLTIFIYYQGVAQESLLSLVRRIHAVYPQQRFELKHADVSEYEGLLPLHGDLMTYFKLSLPEKLPEFDRIIYFDSDMLILGSIRELCAMELGRAPFAAVGGSITYALECKFFAELGYSEPDLGINAGMLVLNAGLWRSEGLKEVCKEFGKRHCAACRSADQTILTGLFARQFVRVSPEFNECWGPWGQKPSDARIVHFVGSPKPWDLGGRWLHSAYGAWRSYAKRGGHAGLPFWCRYGASMLLRTWHIRRSLARAALRKIRRIGKG